MKLTFLSFAAMVLLGSSMAYAAGSQQDVLSTAPTNQTWWPSLLDLGPLRQNHPASNPYGDHFKYSDEFKMLNLDEIKKDIQVLLTTSQPWWPSDLRKLWAIFHPNGMA